MSNNYEKRYSMLATVQLNPKLYIELNIYFTKKRQKKLKSYFLSVFVVILSGISISAIRISWENIRLLYYLEMWRIQDYWRFASILFVLKNIKILNVYFHSSTSVKSALIIVLYFHVTKMENLSSRWENIESSGEVETEIGYSYYDWIFHQ